LKPKTAFESGNSPPKVSENGAAIQTGRGLESVRREIAERFEKARSQHPVQPQKTPVLADLEPSSICRDTEARKAKFERYSNALVSAALRNPVVRQHSRRVDQRGAWVIEDPSQTAEELIREALGE
jgi:hypothetical protein